MKLLVTSPLNVGNQHRVLYYDIGRSASVVMLAQDGGLGLRTNGLPEALMDSPGSLQRFSGEYWLSPLAVIARPRGPRHADRRIRRRRRDRRRAADGAQHRRHRDRAQGHRSQPDDQRAAQAQSAQRSARQRHRQRCARRAAAHQPPLRRHRVAALASVDRRRVAPVHARVHAARARPPHAGWRFRAVDERHLHGRGPDALADRDAAQRVRRSARLSSRSEHRRVPGQRPAAESRSCSWRRPATRCAVRPCTTRASASTTSRTCSRRWCSTRKARGASPPARR